MPARSDATAMRIGPRTTAAFVCVVVVAHGAVVSAHGTEPVRSFSRPAELRPPEPPSRPVEAPRTPEVRPPEPHAIEPRGTEPRGTEPRGPEPRGPEPRGTEPRGIEPRGAEPRPAESMPPGPPLGAHGESGVPNVAVPTVAPSPAVTPGPFDRPLRRMRMATVDGSRDRG